MNHSAAHINTIIKSVRTKDFYIPRDYKTIGGMWTVETWKREDITIKVMDEGYTTVITAPGLHVIQGYDGHDHIHFEIGDESVVEKVAKKLNSAVQK